MFSLEDDKKTSTAIEKIQPISDQCSAAKKCNKFGLT